MVLASLRVFISAAQENLLFSTALGFLAIYPLVSAVVWVVTSLIYRYRRERAGDDSFYAIPDEDLPPVSVLVPSYKEAASLPGTLRALLALDYPRFEIVVVDDGSGDDTPEVVRAFAEEDRRVRLVRKEVNEGKAMAMNDAVPLCRGEIVVVVDADIRPHPSALRYITAHFVRLPRVGAVTGNPRVSNCEHLLAKLQALEFTSIVSILRRAQVVWGRILTVSGAISAFRKSALEDVGLFDPRMATEDIEVSWRLQRRYYDVRYEPRALVEMEVPPTFAALWRQRRRWARGLAQVLRRHASLLVTWRDRRMWPVVVEALCSIVWAHLLIGFLAMWALSVVVGVPMRGASPIPNWWGMLIGTAALVQLAVGVRLDSRYDPRPRRAFLWAPIYPLGYWFLMAIVTVRSTLPALLRPATTPDRWVRTTRVGDAPAAPAPTPRPAPSRSPSPLSGLTTLALASDPRTGSGPMGGGPGAATASGDLAVGGPR